MAASLEGVEVRLTFVPLNQKTYDVFKKVNAVPLTTLSLKSRTSKSQMPGGVPIPPVFSNNGASIKV